MKSMTERRAIATRILDGFFGGTPTPNLVEQIKSAISKELDSDDCKFTVNILGNEIGVEFTDGLRVQTKPSSI